MLKDKLHEFINDLDRQPLLKKTSVLFSLFNTSHSMKSYQFDLGQLERIDVLRYQCTQGGADVANLSSFDADMEYLEQTAEFFIDACAKELGIELPEIKIPT